jgi:hypothetical protein
MRYSQLTGNMQLILQCFMVEGPTNAQRSLSSFMDLVRKVWFFKCIYRYYDIS